MEKFNYNPSEGFRDSSAFPNPANSQEARNQLMIPLDQLREFLNNTLLPRVKTITSDGSIEVTYGEESINLRILVSPEGVTKEYVDEQITQVNDRIDESIGDVDTFLTTLIYGTNEQELIDDLNDILGV